MTTAYPSALDTGSSLHNDRVVNDPIPPSDHNDLTDAVIAVEEAVGIDTTPAAGSLRYLLQHGILANELIITNSQNVALAADTDDLTVSSSTSVLRLTASAAPRSLTGITGGTPGRVLIVRNVGAAQSIILRDEDSSSVAANRFLLGSDVTLDPHQALLLQYDSADARWDVVASWGGSGGGGGGSVTLVNQGTWDSSTTYAINDFVLDGNSTYIAIAPSTDSEPPSADWALLAQGGIDGQDGSDGAQGEDGAQGDQGRPGPSSESYDSILTAAGGITLDAADATMYELITAGDVIISLADTSGVQASSITVRIKQGTTAPDSVTWDNVAGWFTSDGAPPSTATVSGKVQVFVFDRMPSFGWFGYAPGDGFPVTLTAPSFPTLNIEDLTSATSTSDRDAPGGWTAVGSSVQIGDMHGGVAAVVLTRADAIAPVAPTLAGGGASAWTLIQEVQQTTTASLRRALFLYVARDEIAGAATAFDVTLGGSSTLLAYTGMMLKVCRTVGAVPDTWVDTMVAKAAGRTSDDSGENTSVIHCPLGAADHAVNRGIVAFSSNQASGSVPTGQTPEANWALVGTGVAISGPNQALWIMFNGTAFDTTPSTTPASAGAWLAAGSELEQG